MVERASAASLPDQRAGSTPTATAGEHLARVASKLVLPASGADLARTCAGDGQSAPLPPTPSSVDGGPAGPQDRTVAAASCSVSQSEAADLIRRRDTLGPGRASSRGGPFPGVCAEAPNPVCLQSSRTPAQAKHSRCRLAEESPSGAACVGFIGRACGSGRGGCSCQGNLLIRLGVLGRPACAPRLCPASCVRGVCC